MTNFCQACGGAISLHFSTLPGCRCVNPPPIKLMPGAVVPVDAETTAALVGEIKRMMHIIGGMALNQRYPWVGLTDEEVKNIVREAAKGSATKRDGSTSHRIAKAIEAKLKEKNHG